MAPAADVAQIEAAAHVDACAVSNATGEDALVDVELAGGVMTRESRGDGMGEQVAQKQARLAGQRAAHARAANGAGWNVPGEHGSDSARDAGGDGASSAHVGKRDGAPASPTPARPAPAPP